MGSPRRKSDSASLLTRDPVPDAFSTADATKDDGILLWVCSATREGPPHRESVTAAVVMAFPIQRSKLLGLFWLWLDAACNSIRVEGRGDGCVGAKALVNTSKEDRQPADEIIVIIFMIIAGFFCLPPSVSGNRIFLSIIRMLKE